MDKHEIKQYENEKKKKTQIVGYGICNVLSG